MHSDPWHTLRTKGRANTKGEQASCHTGPSLPRGRKAGERQPEPEGKGLLQSQPQGPHLPQTVSRLPVANHVFLRSWSIDLCQECHSLRSASQRRHRDAWDCALTAHLGNRGARTGEVNKMNCPPGTVCSPSTQSPDLLRPGKGTKHTAHLDLWPCREPECIRPGKCTKHRADLGQFPCRAPWRLSVVDPGSTCCLGL